MSFVMLQLSDPSFVAYDMFSAFHFLAYELWRLEIGQVYVLRRDKDGRAHQRVGKEDSRVRSFAL